MRARARNLGLATGLVALLSGGAVNAADLIILGNQGALPGVRALATGFAAASGHRVTVLEESGSALKQRIAEGPADLITLSPEAMAELERSGALVPGSVTPFVLAGLGVSVRAGAPKPDISTVEAYRQTLRDPEFIDMMRKQAMDVDPIEPGEIERIVRTMYSSSPSAVARARDIVGTN